MTEGKRKRRRRGRVLWGSEEAEELEGSEGEGAEEHSIPGILVCVRMSCFSEK